MFYRSVSLSDTVKPDEFRTGEAIEENASLYIIYNIIF